MAEFTPITTQEEFDAAIKSRLERQENTIRKEYSDYEALKKAAAELEDLKKGNSAKAQEDAQKLADLKKELEQAKGEVKAFQVKELKASVAAEIGLPGYLMERINGQTEEEIRADAKALYEAFSAENRKGLPGFNPEQPKDKGAAALKEVLRGLNLNA